MDRVVLHSESLRGQVAAGDVGRFLDRVVPAVRLDGAAVARHRIEGELCRGDVVGVVTDGGARVLRSHDGRTHPGHDAGQGRNQGGRRVPGRAVHGRDRRDGAASQLRQGGIAGLCGAVTPDSSVGQPHEDEGDAAVTGAGRCAKNVPVDRSCARRPRGGGRDAQQRGRGRLRTPLALLPVGRAGAGIACRQIHGRDALAGLNVVEYVRIHEKEVVILVGDECEGSPCAGRRSAGTREVRHPDRRHHQSHQYASACCLHGLEFEHE